MQIPKLLDEIEALRLHKANLSLSDTQLAIAMNSFGWNGAWSAASLAKMFSGRLKINNNEQRQFIQAFLLGYYISTL